MTLSVKVDRHATVVTVDDGKANALSQEVVMAMRRTLREATEAQRPLVITGRPGVFSAGFDLAVIRSDDDAAIAELVGSTAQLFKEFVEAPVPIIAACTGHALAAGALLLLATDRRIGPVEHCKIGLIETRSGMTLPPFAVALARHRLCITKLSDAALFGNVGDPQWAVSAGFLDELAEDPLGACYSYASTITSEQLKAMADTKRLLRAPLVRELGAPSSAEETDRSSVGDL